MIMRAIYFFSHGYSVQPAPKLEGIRFKIWQILLILFSWHTLRFGRSVVIIRKMDKINEMKCF